MSVHASLQAREVHYFAGRARGVEAAGAGQVRKINVSATLTDAQYRTHVMRLEEFAVTPAPFLYRDPLGRRIYCTILSMEAPRAVGGVWKLSLELEEVER